MKVFADFEYNGQPTMEAIQFGAVLTDNNCTVISTYHSLVHPTLPITQPVEELTHITNKDVEKADDFHSVFYSFVSWLSSYANDKLTFYAWGEDWRQIRRECKVKGCLDEFETLMKENDRVNYQRELSMKTLYKGQLMTKSIALEDMKKLYNLPSEVKHDALSDAMDTMMVYRQVEIDKIPYQEEHLRRIFEEKQEHMQRMKECKKKQTLNMFKNLIDYGEFKMYIDSSIYRKLKSGPGDIYREIEHTVNDAGLFSKQCVYYPNTVSLTVRVINVDLQVIVKYTVHYYNENVEIEREEKFQLEVTEGNRRFVSHILYKGLQNMKSSSV